MLARSMLGFINNYKPSSLGSMSAFAAASHMYRSKSTSPRILVMTIDQCSRSPIVILLVEVSASAHLDKAGYMALRHCLHQPMTWTDQWIATPIGKRLMNLGRAQVYLLGR